MSDKANLLDITKSGKAGRLGRNFVAKSAVSGRSSGQQHAGKTSRGDAETLPRIPSWVTSVVRKRMTMLPFCPKSGRPICILCCDTECHLDVEKPEPDVPVASLLAERWRGGH